MHVRTDSLDGLVRPRAIAVVGASADPDKLNGRIVRFLREKGYPGPVYPVNPKASVIEGYRCYPTLADVPGTPDLVVIALAAAQAGEAIREAGLRGASAALVFASGFAETGEEGRRRQAELREIARRSGVRLCGPNSVGVVNAFDHVVATFSQIGNNIVHPGGLAFVTQSGALGTVVNTLAQRRKLGLGYVVHTGNEADVTAVDAIAAVAADDRVRVVGAYLEGVRDGAALCELARDLAIAGKPLVVVKVGRGATGARAVASHTGALATEDRLFGDLARQAGIVRARNEAHLLDLCEGFLRCPLPPVGGGLGIVTQSGGTAVLMADRADELGLRMPGLSDSTRETLATFLPSYASFDNPVDASMQAVADPALLGRSLATVLDDPSIGVGVVWLQHMDAKADELVRMFADLRLVAAKPWIVAWAAPPEHAVDALRAAGVCVFESAETAVDVARGLVEFAMSRQRLGEVATPLPAADVRPAPGVVAALDAARRLAHAGVALPSTELAASATEAVSIAHRLGVPVALKIESRDIAHKTEVGGVRLGLTGDVAVASAFDDVVASARARAPAARIDGALLQAMAAPGVELVVGLRRDPSFGMLVMLGLGGVFVEVLRDVCFRRAPVSRDEARSMIEELRGRRLLDSFRGRDAVDLDAIAELVRAVAAFGAANDDWLEELDLNPVIARADGAVAVDWLMLAASDGERP